MGCMCGKDTLSIRNDRFTVKHRLGEGGFSVIDLVKDNATNKQMALKRIVCHSEGDEMDALQEAEYMVSVKHRNLVPCVTYGVQPTSSRQAAISEVLIVMPYYKKGSVYDEIETLRLRQAYMLEKRVITLLRGIVNGLHALHTLSPTPLAHRDVKPHNVMLDVDGNGEDIPVLMDFGSMGPAKQEISNRTQATALQDLAAEKCSMPYRAPELFHVESNSVIDERVDIWSLGCTLHAMCYHESPFDKVYQRGDSIALAVIAGNIKLPDNGHYTHALTKLLLSMLSVSPEGRPSTQRILDSLDQLYTHVAESGQTLGSESAHGLTNGSSSGTVQPLAITSQQNGPSSDIILTEQGSLTNAV